MKLIFAAAVAALITGCAMPVVQPGSTSTVTLQDGKIPEVGKTATASVGNPVFTQFRYWSRVGTRLDSGVSARVALGRIEAPSGSFLFKSQVEGEDVFCTESMSYIDPLTGPFKPACFVDRDRDGRFEIVKAAPGAIWFETKLPVPVGYATGEDIRPTPDSKKMELLYQGFASKTVKLSYREYINDMARPAFFQDASYEIESFPSEISFKGLRLRLLSAGNSGIEYMVLSPF